MSVAYVDGRFSHGYAPTVIPSPAPVSGWAVIEYDAILQSGTEMVIPAPVRLPVIDGRLCDVDGAPGPVEMQATDDPDLFQDGARAKVTVQLSGSSLVVFHVALPAGETVQLHTVAAGGPDDGRAVFVAGVTPTGDAGLTQTFQDSGSQFRSALDDTYIERTEVGSTVETPAGAQAKADAAEAEAKTYAGTLAYGTNLEATDAVVAGFVDDPGSQTGAAIADTYATQADLGIFATRYGVKADGITDDTVAMQAAIDAAITAKAPLVLPPGTILTGPLDGNGTGTIRNPDQQWPGLRGLYGAGRTSTVLKALPGAYVAGDYVLTHNNVAGAKVYGFRIEGDGIATHGADFSWKGGSSGDPTLAPSNLNEYSDIMVRTCSAMSINFDKQHDSKLSNISVGGSSGVGISFIGPGGLLTMDEVFVHTGTLNIACQNASIVNSGFFNGVVLEGASYNSINWHASHFFPNPATGITIESVTAGNATRGMVFAGAYFNTSTNIIAGRFWEGVEFIGCNFIGYTSFFGTITPAAGAGSLPGFAFRGCSISGPTPVDIPNQALVTLEHCRSNTGAIINSRMMKTLDDSWAPPEIPAGGYVTHLLTDSFVVIGRTYVSVSASVPSGVVIHTTVLEASQVRLTLQNLTTNPINIPVTTWKYDLVRTL